MKAGYRPLTSGGCLALISSFDVRFAHAQSYMAFEGWLQATDLWRLPGPDLLLEVSNGVVVVEPHHQAASAPQSNLYISHEHKEIIT